MLSDVQGDCWFAWHFLKSEDFCSLGEVRGILKGTEHVLGLTLFPDGRAVFPGGMESVEEGYRDKGSSGGKEKGLERLARSLQCRKTPPEVRVATFSGPFKSDFQCALHVRTSWGAF